MYMKLTENIMVFDTETVNMSADTGFNMNNNMVFDFGCVIMDTDFNKIFRYNKLVKEIWENAELMSKYVFDDEKLQWYKDEVAAGRLEVIPFAQMSKEVHAIIEEYDVEVFSAYNMGFDVRAVSDTAMSLKSGIFIDFDNEECWDLYHMACHALQGNDNYVVACMENGLVSPSGNVKANAEAVYSFITNNFAFIEDHTALSDAEIEADIMRWVLELEKEKQVYFKREIYSQAWRLVQRKKDKK